MSLMDLYGNVPGMQRRPDWMNYEGGASPSMSLAVPDQGAVNYYASQPRQEPKKGGGLGDVLKTLFAGALDGVARHYGFEPGGYNTMMQQREEERQQGLLMQKLMAEQQMKRWEWENAPPERTTAYREYIDAGYTDAQAKEQMRLDAAGRRTKLVTPNENAGAGIWAPESGYRSIVEPNPGDVPMGTPVTGGNIPRVSSPQEAMRLPPGSKFMTPDGRIGTVPGGGVSNDPSNFRP